jgi:apolipoprotein N-acyltransferase
MKDHDGNRHPGPWRVMSVDSETTGIIVAVGFLAMGLVSIPVARWFVLGCLALGALFAVLLRFTPKRFIRVVVAAVIVLIVVLLWWAGTSITTTE